LPRELVPPTYTVNVRDVVSAATVKLKPVPTPLVETPDVLVPDSIGVPSLHRNGAGR